MFYGLGLNADKIGDYVRKPMGECSGREILEELLHHLKFDADLERILDSSNVNSSYLVPPVRRGESVTETMRAERFYADTKKVALEDVPGPGARARRGAGAGSLLRHMPFGRQSDQRNISGSGAGGDAGARGLSGTIAKLGPGVTDWAEGGRVVVCAGRRCGVCPACRRGENVDGCLDVRIMAFAYDGAWAEYTVAEASGLTPHSRQRPDGAGRDTGRCGSDPVRRRRSYRQSGDRRIGRHLGRRRRGTHLVQLAKLVGAVPAIAFDINPAVRDRALELGADYAFD